MKTILTTLVSALLICSNLSFAAGRSKPVVVDTAEHSQDERTLDEGSMLLLGELERGGGRRDGEVNHAILR